VADIGEQPDLLRAVGRTLDSLHASEIEITFREVFMSISWQSPAGGAQQRSFEDIELEALRDQARQMRGGLITNPVSGQLAELLRTLGQELSSEELEATSIVEEGDGFRVSGVARGRYVRQMYWKTELKRLSEQRRAMRGRSRPPGGSLGGRLS
jgi:hypothetical protein